MIIYNVSIHLHPNIENQWIKWMKEIHIPEVMATGCFTSYQFNKLVFPLPEDHVTYIIQYYAPDMETYEKYRDTFAPVLQKKGHDLFGGHFTGFRTLMEQIS